MYSFIPGNRTQGIRSFAFAPRDRWVSGRGFEGTRNEEIWKLGLVARIRFLLIIYTYDCSWDAFPGYWMCLRRRGFVRKEDAPVLSSWEKYDFQAKVWSSLNRSHSRICRLSVECCGWYFFSGLLNCTHMRCQGTVTLLHI